MGHEKNGAISLQKLPRMRHAIHHHQKGDGYRFMIDAEKTDRPSTVIDAI